MLYRLSVIGDHTYEQKTSDILLNVADKETIAIYAREYSRLPKIEGLTVLNDSDIMTDYFEQDRAYIEPSNPLFTQVQIAYNQGRAKDLRRWIKKLEKRIVINPKQIYKDDIARYKTELQALE